MSKTTDDQLSSNLPKEGLTRESDCFDVLDKANFITELLTKGNKVLGENKMLVLYGGWGAGKSTVMKHIKKELETKEFPVVFFEAWKYEKDNNLPLSLIAAISDIHPSKEVKELMKLGLSIFKSVFSSLEFDFKFIKFKPKDGLDTFETDIERVEKAYSAYEHSKEFEEKFVQVEKSIIELEKGKSTQKNSKKLVVFIDDLDRCEPEHTLGLLTAIKLFFTYGKDTIFVCGVDKSAIKNALITKYGDTIKADEYLEKVFDISFTMPEPISLRKMLGLSLPGETMVKTIELIDEFLQAIGFTNARHVKKVLNKFKLIKELQHTFAGSHISKIIPPNLHKDKWEIIFTLYFIILFEFHYDKFVELENWEIKKASYTQKNMEEYSKTSSDITFQNQFMHISRYFSNISVFSLNNIKFKNGMSMMQLMLIFMPKDSNSRIEINDKTDAIPMILAIFDSSENKMLVKFCTFLYEKFKIEESETDKVELSSYNIWNFFKMARTMF